MSEGPWKLPKGWRWVRLGEVAVRDTVTINPSSGDANGWPKFWRLEPRILVRYYPEVFSHYKRPCRVISGLDASTQVLEKFLEQL